MNRLDLLPQNQLGALLKQVEDDLREIKNRQRYSGLSGLLGYFVSNPDTWDETGVCSDSGGDFGYREYQIVFTASGKQPFPIENVQLDIRFGGEDEENKPFEQSNGIWGWGDGVNFAAMWNRNPSFDVTYSDNETQYRWRFGFDVSGTLPYYIKAYVSGSSDGTVVVSEII